MTNCCFTIAVIYICYFPTLIFLGHSYPLQQENIDSKDETVRDLLKSPSNQGDKDPDFVTVAPFYEGNIELLKDGENEIEFKEIDMMYLKDSRKRRAVSTLEDHKWDEGIVPYAFDTATGKTLSAAARDLINQSMVHISERTCIKFVPRTSEINYVLFTRGAGCASFIGNVRFGERGNLNGQDISIGDSCIVLSVIVHEILHALGFIHEHTRLDRDQYIFVNKTNIRDGLESQFEVYTSRYQENEISTLDTLYDKTSVMHYDRFTFTNKADQNNRVLFRQQFMTMYSLTNWRDELGNRNGLSDMDIQRVKQHYNCPTTTTTTTRTTVAARESTTTVKTTTKAQTTTVKTTAATAVTPSSSSSSSNQATKTTEDSTRPTQDSTQSTVTRSTSSTNDQQGKKPSAAISYQPQSFFIMLLTIFASFLHYL